MSIVQQNDDNLVTRENQVSIYREQQTISALEKVIANGDLSKLTPQERLIFYRRTCESCGLNPLTKPFIYISLNGKLVLYPVKECAEQLRMIHGVATKITERKALFDDSIYQVSVFAQNREGRTDEAVGCVPIKGLQGADLANALMKAETKAKRRVTFSICGLGWMADATDQAEEGHYTGLGLAPEIEGSGDDPGIDPSCADIVDPVVEEAKRKAKGDFMAVMMNWAGQQDYAWEPVKVIIDRTVEELEQKFGQMNANKWSDLLRPTYLKHMQQRVHLDYAAVDNELRCKTDGQPVTKPEGDPTADAWEKMIADAKDELGDERLAGEE